MKAFFRALLELLGPQPSLHAVRVGDYTYSYRTQPLGPRQYFSVKAVSQAEADMRARRKIAELGAGNRALTSSLDRA